MMSRLDELFEWLVDGAPGISAPIDVADRIGNDLAASGFALMRFGVFITSLHPAVAGRAFIWERGKPTRMSEQSWAVRRSPDYLASPIKACCDRNAELRWRAGEDDQGYQAIRDFQARGCVDYVCMPLRFLDGVVHAITVTSDVGFTDQQLADLRRILRPLARLAEILALRRSATSILNAYVGQSSGARVIAGQIERGNVDLISAVIWFSDLRGFTSMSTQLDPVRVIAVINDVFDCQVPPIEQHGGEVLKFIGDGLLAIFPVTADRSGTTQARAALDAAAAAFTRLATLNASRGSDHRIGLALHIGEIAYGNIGSEMRLDFTAIGTAVNTAARLEGLASKLGKSLVVSADLAALAERDLEDLGTHDLKGLATQRVFAPRG